MHKTNEINGTRSRVQEIVSLVKKNWEDLLKAMKLYIHINSYKKCN